MPRVEKNFSATAILPHLCCMVSPARGDTLAIGRPSYSIHSWIHTSMAMINADLLSTASTPHLCGLVSGSTCNVLPIRRPGDFPDMSGMAFVGDERGTCRTWR